MPVRSFLDIDEIAASLLPRNFGRKQIEDLISFYSNRKCYYYKEVNSFNVNAAPPAIVGRIKELHDLADLYGNCGNGCCAPPQWVTIRGWRGTGKTTVIRHFLENFSGCDHVIVSLAGCNTVLGCLNGILDEMGLDRNTNANRGTDVAINKIRNYIKQRVAKASSTADQKRLFILVLDDFDAILLRPADHHTSASHILTNLLSIVEPLQQKGYPVGIMAVTTTELLPNAELDDRIRSRIETSSINFSPYLQNELIAILKDRIDSGLFQKPPFSVVKECASMCANESGDARQAITLLKSALDLGLAVGVSPSSLQIIHLRWARNKMMTDQDDSVLSAVKSLPLQPKTLAGVVARLAYITEQNKMSGPEIYKHYQNVMKKEFSFPQVLGRRQINAYLVKLEEIGMLTSLTTSQGKCCGRQKVYVLMVPADILGPVGLGEFWHKTVTTKQQIADLRTLKQIKDESKCTTPAVNENMDCQLNLKMAALQKELLL